MSFDSGVTWEQRNGTITRELRINDRIRAREVLLIDDNGAAIRHTASCRKRSTVAREQDLDLVEVAPNANPPVCRLLDYGKFKYEQAKKDRDSKKGQHASVFGRSACAQRLIPMTWT